MDAEQEHIHKAAVQLAAIVKSIHAMDARFPWDVEGYYDPNFIPDDAIDDETFDLLPPAQ